MPPPAAGAEVVLALRERYGFDVTVVTDATRQDILDALDRLRPETDADDAVLVYYAGHGSYDDGQQRGYWLPSDALLISDSCFSGSLFRDAGVAAKIPSPRGTAEARRLAAKKSRWRTGTATAG